MIGRLDAVITLATGVLLAAVVDASAQTVTVRSGDHEGFARLVIEFPGERPGWRLMRDGRSYVLFLDAPDLRLDTADVFRLIGRDRVASVEQDGPGAPMSIGLSCDCHAEAFEYAASALVVDVRDGPGPGSAISETKATDTESGKATPRTSMTSRPAPVPGPTVPGAILPFSWQSETEIERLSPESVTNPDPMGADLPQGSPRDPLVVAAIAERLGRASSQGLVELLPGALARETVAVDGAGSRRDLTDRPDVSVNLRVLTDVDRSFGVLGPDRLVDRTEPACLPDSLIAVQSWGDEHRLGQDLAAYRADIIDAGDRPDPRAVRDLARHYVFLTFGAEARGLLDAFPDDTQDTKVLRALADVMDDRAMQPDGLLAGQADCTSQVALWAFLASPQPPAEIPATAAIVTTFSGLPLHLRRHLAPRLAAAFDAVDEPEAARAVLSAVTRAPGRHGAAVAHATAIREDDRATRDAALQPLLASDPEDAAKAVLALLERDLSEGGPVDPDLIENAGAFGFELRALPVGQALAEARIRGLAVNGRLRDALRDLANLATRDEAMHRVPDLAGELLGRAEEASDVDLLALASALARLTTPETLPADARIPAAARLIELGAVDLSERYLVPEDEADPRVRLARARQAIATGEPSRALALVADLDGTGAARVEAEALVLLGDRRGLAETVAGSGAPARSSGDERPARTDPLARSGEPQTPLALLEEAKDLRLGLESLLAGQQP